ncbi:MAG TPA: phage tail sheath C-terminal domain-containing protein [Longimicrobium sp.]|jgi:phage tail sheath protein FI|nr:phage tail sheath C-terminal domain-containing protein [Longimicrobium sp.]
MPTTTTYTTPGVYVVEKTAFPPSVVGVKTAVPAFIGYTQKAEVAGQPVELVPIKIGSLADFEEKFGTAYKPIYTITLVDDPTTDTYDFRVMNPTLATPAYQYYKLTTTDGTFNLYNSMRLFYANGGGECYVVSVGPYATTSGGVTTPTTIAGSDLTKGLKAIKEQVGPTMLVVPDAVLLPPTPATKDTTPWVSSDFTDVIQAMLQQCEALQDRVAILDVYGTQYLTPPAQHGATQDLIIDQFRLDLSNTGVSDTGLSYGMAYFPFLDTTVVQAAQITYDNLNIADSTATGDGLLQKILTWQTTDTYPAGDPRIPLIVADINKIAPANTASDIKTLNHNLTASVPLLTQIEGVVAEKESVLPPSAAMAGVMSYVDTTRGVWNAPANVSLAAVDQPTVAVNATQQSGLNVPVDGKAVDALRTFPGRGTVVWGARTLNGNSPDYRYIQVRRTLIYIEQSIKNALNQFVFAPNNGQTWTTVTSTVSGFLQTVWSQGGLMGAKASDAFTVQCGLGSTMTGQDILNGNMIVQVTLQMIRPAEFIELTFKQTMEGVS